ncbi:endonuclease domain-containing protein [Marinomonas agarivorans]|nr:endonuclease domain-containing protein [Marinomonas agarivorans]
MTKLFNTKHNAVLRSELRKAMTEPEQRLWYRLRNKQLGVKFRRQFGIGRYIVDFYCPEKRLVIEVDGDSHFSKAGLSYDSARDEYIKSLDIQVVRFTNLDVMQNIEGVLFAISERL